MEVRMKIEKKNLNEALKVLGKVVSQTSPVEVQKSIRFERSEMLDIGGAHLDYPQIKQPTEDAVAAILPVNFGDLLALAAPIIDRNNYRRILQGVNLSSSGVTVTDGKQLLHQPCHLALSKPEHDYFMIFQDQFRTRQVYCRCL